MTVKRFRTKIVEIDAVQFTGDNFDELYKWTEGNFRNTSTDEGSNGFIELKGDVYDKLHATWIHVYPGQWIVRGAKGEYYPCDDETFHWKYEEVESIKLDPFIVAQIDYKFFKEDWRDKR